MSHMIYIDVRLFTQPLNGTAPMHQVAVGIFASTRTDVMYTMGLFKPDSLAIYILGLRVRKIYGTFCTWFPTQNFPKNGAHKCELPPKVY